jgi:hypothetical protein
MKLKTISLLLVTIIAMTLLVSCGQATATTAKIDVTAAASIVDNAAAFEKSIAKDGKWIICTTKDLTIDKELVLDGNFKNGKKDTAGNEILQRKIGLYTQDASSKITNRVTLTAKKLTVNSANASIEHGTFKGDLYLTVKNFKLIDATVDGNVYFQSDDIKASFTMDATSKITGAQTVKAN